MLKVLFLETSLLSQQGRNIADGLRTIRGDGSMRVVTTSPTSVRLVLYREALIAAPAGKGATHRGTRVCFVCLMGRLVISHHCACIGDAVHVLMLCLYAAVHARLKSLYSATDKGCFFLSRTQQRHAQVPDRSVGGWMDGRADATRGQDGVRRSVGPKEVYWCLSPRL